jgi:hypothetical protein
MDLYVFSSATWQNVEIGFTNGLWAVSPAEPQVMAARRTRAQRVQTGDRGVLYVAKAGKAGFTVPFFFKSTPQLYATAPPIWPEPWEMPFEIDPLGSPERWWLARHAASALPFNQGRRVTNLSSLFNCQGTTVFAPIEIGEDDWEMLLSRLGS